MADLDIASVDLAAGLKVKNLVVPPMTVNVVYKNAPADLLKEIKKDKVIVQKIAVAVFDALKKSRAEFQSAIKDLDASYDKKPPADMKEAEDRVHTLNVVCKQIAEAQTGVATKAAMDEWATQQKKNKALREYDGFFAARLVLGLIAIGASVVHTVMTFGASSAIAIVSIAKTVVAMGLDIQNHCRDMAKTEADIIKADDVLAKTWKNGTKSGGKVGRELAAALGVPFVKSIGGFGTLLKEYDAKNGRRGKLADDLWKKAKELMAKIAETSSKAGPEMKKKLTSLGAKVTDLLNQVGEIVSASTECDAFSASYHAHYDTYKAFEGKALSGVAKGSNIAVLAAGILSTADTILKVATALA